MDPIERERVVAALRERVAIGEAIKGLAEQLATKTTQEAEHNIEGINMVMEIILDRQRKAAVVLDANLALEGIDEPPNT